MKKPILLKSHYDFGEQVWFRIRESRKGERAKISRIIFDCDKIYYDINLIDQDGFVISSLDNVSSCFLHSKDKDML